MEAQWGIFVTNRGGTMVQLDVAPTSWNRRMLKSHIRGALCACKPRRATHPQDIPIYVHERCFITLNQMEDAMPTDPKYDPNQKPGQEPKKDDETKKKKPGEEDEEEETDKRQEQKPR